MFHDPSIHQLSLASLIQTGDNNGLNATECALPTYFGGAVDENSICGYWVNPINIGQVNLIPIHPPRLLPYGLSAVPGC